MHRLPTLHCETKLLRLRWLPCSDSVHSSCYSQGQNLCSYHSDMVHRWEIPTSPWGTGGQSYVLKTQTKQTNEAEQQCVSVVVQVWQFFYSEMTWKEGTLKSQLSLCSLQINLKALQSNGTDKVWKVIEKQIFIGCLHLFIASGRKLLWIPSI